MSTADPPPNKFFSRRGEAAGRSRIPPLVQKVVLLLLSAMVVFGGMALKFGWFPFDDRNRLVTELKADVRDRAGLSFAGVEITGDGTAVGTLPDGERLAIRWKRDGGRIHSLCQRPTAESEQTLRRALQQEYGMKHGPVKSLRVHPSEVGVGYVGEATMESGVIYDVFETTDVTAMRCYQEFWQSPKTYARPAKEKFEKEIRATVTAVTVLQDGDFPTPAPDGGERYYAARMRTAGGVYAVELYRDKPGDPTPELRLRHRKLGP